MKIKNINLFKVICLITVLVYGPVAFAQTDDEVKEERKVVIVEKIIDEEGNETVKERVLEGKEAELYLMEKKLADILEDELDLEELEERLGDENIRLMEIEKRISEEMEKNMDVNIQEKDGNYKIRMNVDGEEMEWEGVGEIPDEVREELESMEIELPEMNEHIVMIQEDQEDRAVLGVMVENAGGNGALVTNVFEDSGAEKAGLEKGDLILKIDRQKVDDIESLIDALNDKDVGDKVKVKYLRDGKKKSERVVLGEMIHKSRWHSKDKNCNVHMKKCHDPSMGHKMHSDKKKVKKIVVVKKSSDKEGEVIEEIISPAEVDLYEINVYPNPGDGVVNLEFKAAAVPTTVKIITMDGQELYNQTIENFDGSFMEQLDIERQEGGVILQIQQNGKVYTETILK